MNKEELAIYIHEQIEIILNCEKLKEITLQLARQQKEVSSSFSLIFYALQDVTNLYLGRLFDSKKSSPSYKNSFYYLVEDNKEGLMFLERNKKEIDVIKTRRDKITAHSDVIDVKDKNKIYGKIENLNSFLKEMNNICCDINKDVNPEIEIRTGFDLNKYFQLKNDRR